MESSRKNSLRRAAFGLLELFLLFVLPLIVYRGFADQFLVAKLTLMQLVVIAGAFLLLLLGGGRAEHAEGVRQPPEGGRSPPPGFRGGDRLRRGSVRSRLRLEVAHPSLISGHLLAANTQLALAA